MLNLKIELKWATIFVGMSLLWMILEKLLGLHDKYIDKHAIFTNFIAIPAILIYVLALLDKRKNDYNGRMTYKQGVICGLIITAMVTVVSPITQYITTNIITPEYFPNVIKYSVNSGKLTQQDAENYFNLKSYIIQGLIGAPIMGIITTLIVAFFTKKK
jgi:hypothetical protein